MTTKEYVAKYNLDKSDKFNHSLFVQDLAEDLIALLEINKAKDNIKGFNNAVRCVKMKFDAINNKTLGEIPEKLWKFFFATVVVKLREEMCPVEMDKRREIKEDKQRQYQERKRWEQEMFNDFWDRSFYNFLFGARKAASKPTSYFADLGIADNSNVADVKAAYKQLSLIHHPDKGGKQDRFVQITEAKNKCLEWLNNN